MNASSGVVLRLPTEEFRSLPLPRSSGSGDGRAKIATCFVRAEELPGELKKWMGVNPRVPKFNKKEKLVGPVAKAMVQTLTGEPEKFALKNQGIYVLVRDVSFERHEGGGGVVSIRLDDPAIHGLVNGGHTYMAIQEAQEDRDETVPWNAYVRLHIIEGFDESDIGELAEGLNRSMQVDDPSLENLAGTFDRIKQELSGKRGHEQIAYRQGDLGELDVRELLTYMGFFDLNQFPDRKSHPNKLFGQQKKVLQDFIKDCDRPEKGQVLTRILPRLHEILVLADEIQKRAVKPLAKLKLKATKKNNRVASPKHKGRPAHFSGGTIDGLVHLGWLYPMLAAFRANVSPSAWDEGRLEWVVEPLDLLDNVIDEMAEVLKQEHVDNKEKPGEVGRKEAAYRLCYGIVAMELASRGKHSEMADARA